MTKLSYIGSAAIALLLTILLQPMWISILKNKGLVVENYSGKNIVTAGGLILLFPSILGIIPFWKQQNQDILLYTNLVFSMILIGLIDDALGEGKVKGLKGHIKTLLQGSITTGIMKMFLGVIVGLAISIAYSRKGIDLIFDVFLFALCVNFNNLMDLRPGRSIKAFLFLIILLILSSGFRFLWIVFPLIWAILGYIQYELREECMLGDTGSNLLGGILGMYSIKAAPDFVKYSLVSALFFLHIISEFYSFSKIINAIPILRYIDRLGTQAKERW